MTTDEEKKLFRRYSYCWFLTFPTLLIFGLAFFVKRQVEPLPKALQLLVGWPFALATLLTNALYNHTAAVFIFREWPPAEWSFSSRMQHYHDTGKFVKLRKHLCRMIQSFDPDHFTNMKDL